jgi:hypothetical protein
MPSKIFLSTLAGETLAGTAATLAGLPELMPLPEWQILTIFVYSILMCLGVNEVLKVGLIRWPVLKIAEAA